MAKSAEAERTVRVRIGVVNPPDVTDAGLEFGLQDKDQQLYDGVKQADGSLRFECEVRVKQGTDGKPNFLGEFAHGTPTERFLYLTMKASGAIQWRIKIKLASITWEQVEQVSTGGLLETHVAGRCTGSVKLLGEGWQVVGSA